MWLAAVGAAPYGMQMLLTGGDRGFGRDIHTAIVRDERTREAAIYTLPFRPREEGHMYCHPIRENRGICTPGQKRHLPSSEPGQKRRAQPSKLGQKRHLSRDKEACTAI